jgi:hypothetical protein
MPASRNPILTCDEVQQYRALRRACRIGVLWADNGLLYYADKPSAIGYLRDEARWIPAEEFLAIMRESARVHMPLHENGSQHAAL